MIYFDNAATTKTKPPEVAKAVAHAIANFGDVGRGTHGAALCASMAVHKTRKQIAALFCGPDPQHVAFGQNVTDALNVVIDGLLGPNDCALTTAASHNSILRPLFRKHDREGTEITIVPLGRDGSLDYDAFDALFVPNTKLVVVTHASNLTGDVYDIARMAAIAHAHGALICIDAAQTAGAFPIDMDKDKLDIVCFTGHKSLYGPQGTGGICFAQGVEIPAFKEGGTGTHSFETRQPSSFPERLEAGTLNAHGLAGLSAGLEYLEKVGVDTIQKQADLFCKRFEAGVSTIDGVNIYGGHADMGRVGIVTLNIGDRNSQDVADLLSSAFDICTRAGAHCAPLMHKALGTPDQGAVRFSFSHFNTVEEIDAGIDAVRHIAAQLL